MKQGRRKACGAICLGKAEITRLARQQSQVANGLQRPLRMNWRIGHGAITQVEVNWEEPVTSQIRRAIRLGEAI